MYNIIFTIAVLVVAVGCANKKKVSEADVKSGQVSSATLDNSSSGTSVAVVDEKKPVNPTTSLTLPNFNEEYVLQLYRKSCAQVIAQIVSANKSNLGEEWAPQDARLAKPMANVISIENFCVLPDNLEYGSYIKVKFIAKTTNNCKRCDIGDIPPPATAYAIQYIETMKKL
jgi:hypothetical protein